MKLKNTLGLAIGTIVAATSFGALAQGQGAVEIEGFAKKEQFDSARNFKNDGNLFGGSVGYFLTDDVELRLGYDEVHNVRSDDGKLVSPIRASVRTAAAVVTAPPSPTSAAVPSCTSPTTSMPVLALKLSTTSTRATPSGLLASVSA
jgi:hypothetical protein